MGVRVACLYRVSTMSQVDKNTDDIPMQRIACSDFIKKMQDWKLEREYTEKGVSGYKKKADERDVILQIKRDAECKLFDVLLVFMFDRLGRREDETPFILEWLVNQGIEVWSVKEGQQRFDSRADKLINYIRFWQSGGESEKTGIRVKEKHMQMIKEGKFCGGCAPYGYMLVKSGIENNKGRQLKKLVINEDERKAVELIYKLITEKGYGGHRIALYLNENGIKSRKNSKWGTTTVNYMIRNPIYKGYPAYGKTTATSGVNKRVSADNWHVSQAKVNELAIIDEGVWQKAQQIRSSRTPACYKAGNYTGLNYPMQTKSTLLFTGIIKCGYCGSTLCSYNGVSKWLTKDGEKKVVRPSYRCTSISRGIRCGGQITYSKKKIEEPVIEEIYTYLANMDKINLFDEMSKISNEGIKKEERRLVIIEKEMFRLSDDIKRLNNEITKSISGDSKFTPEQLSSAINQHEMRLSEVCAIKDELTSSISSYWKLMENIKHEYAFPSWVEEFNKAPNEVKKMLICELIDEIVVFKDLIEINFNISYEDFIKETTSYIN